jgi:hypothetical protein
MFRSENEEYYVRFEVFTAVTMKNIVFWDRTQRKYQARWRHIADSTLHNHWLEIINSHMNVSIF